MRLNNQNKECTITRTIVITGASKGIGYAAAARLHEHQYNVIGIARNKPNKPFPGKFYQADLSEETETSRVFELINQEHEVDGLVNNVGMNIPSPLEKIKLADLYSLINLNLRTAVQATQIFSKGMIQRQFGRIINIAARSALGAPNASLYSASKAALVAFTKSLALEFASKGVIVNAIAPGPIATEIFRHHIQVGSELEQQILKNIPMKRCGDPSEIAAVIEFFLSEEAGFITGQVLFVDGGASVGSVIT